MRALLPTLLVLSGCHQNRQALLDRQEQLDRRLASAKAVADSLFEHRRAMDALEEEVASGLAAFPEAQADDDEPQEPTAPSPLPPLPPEGAFEGREGASLRERIADSERRLAQLNKVLGDFESRFAKERRLRRTLARIKQLEKQRK